MRQRLETGEYHGGPEKLKAKNQIGLYDFVSGQMSGLQWEVRWHLT